MELANTDWLYDIDKLDEMGKKDYQQIQKITPKIFIDFLSEKGVKTSCLSCGEESLFIPHTTEHYSDDEDDENYDDSKDITYVTPIPKTIGPFRIHAAKYEVNCSNCGFICHYQTYQVLQWAKIKGIIKDE